MQVLSQLSYNPTDSVGPLVSADIGRHPARLVTGLLDGRVPRSSFAGFHRPGSLENEVFARTGSRVNASHRDYHRARMPSMWTEA